MLTVLHGGGASACTIQQLEKNAQYAFFLIPFYKSIEGKPSNLKQTSTLEDGKRRLLTFCCVKRPLNLILSCFH